MVNENNSDKSPKISMEEFKYIADRAGLGMDQTELDDLKPCLLYTSPSPRD